ncbi:MAG: hypothetical protein ACT6U0_00765 [Shinella sp.]
MIESKSDTGLANQYTFPGPVYQRLPPDMRPPAPSLARRFLDWIPVQDFLAAQFGFTSRFNRTVAHFATEGGSGLSAAQSHFHFGDALFLTIDPKIVRTRLRDNILDGKRPRWIGRHFLDGGDWRPILQPIDRSFSHGEIVEICRLRRNFREGLCYRRYADSINSGVAVQRNRVAIDTIDKLDSYFEDYLALIENIEENGIVPRGDLGLKGQTGQWHRWTRSLWQDLAERDIGVAINASGRLVRHTSGKHRMAAALALGIDSVPVEIRLVHAGWLLRRSERLGLSPKEALLATIERARLKGWAIK